MSKRRRMIPATDLRVHLGEALKGLEDEDLVVVKGGVPVAVLTRYRKEDATMANVTSTRYEQALSKRAETGGWERTRAAMARGWIGLNAEELVASIYRARTEGVTARRYGEIDGDEATDDSTLSARQRRLQQGAPEGRLVADERADYDAGGRPGD